MRTDYVKEKDLITRRKWYVIDAADQILGRLSTKIARVLQGKHRPDYAPHQDIGDFVVVLNADKVKLTGKKKDQKTYFSHSGYIGGGKEVPFRRMMAKRPIYVIEHSVRLMLPKNALGRKIFKKLKVYAGDQHPHQAQQPETLNF